MKRIDLRSDTVTRPTQPMRDAMASAEVGDDVYGEDPTVNELQRRAAELLGKQAGLYVASGTLGNQACIHSLTRPGDVVLASVGAHVLVYESGAASAISGVQIETLGHGETGSFEATDLTAALTPNEAHFAPRRVATIENTHNRAGGQIFPFDTLREVTASAREHGLALHLDGARLFHAVVATGIPAHEWAEPFDTVTFCLSKGLGAPVGSVVCGDRDTIVRVHRARKMLGGGMRQAGILAAAGLYAIDHNIDRLAEDHANALALAKGLEGLGLSLRGKPATNMVMFEVLDTGAFVRAMKKRNLLINAVDDSRLRAVTHLEITAEDIDDALGRISEVLDEGIR